MPSDNGGMALPIPAELAANCRKTPERAVWLKRLPNVQRSLERRWALTLGGPFGGEEVSCSWVAPATRGDGTPAALKLGMPHMEGEHELHGLRFWNGDPTVRLLEADEELGAMLLEGCVPGTAVRALPESDQDMSRPLSTLIEFWTNETLTEAIKWPDADLVREGLQLLPGTAPRALLLATDAPG